jgi:hypothetical protein
MKVTIEHESMTASVEDKEGITIDDALALCGQVLIAVGFSFKGHVTIEE